MIASIAIGGVEAQKRVPVVPLSAVVRSPDDGKRFAVFVVDAAANSGDVAKVHTQDVNLGDAYGNLSKCRSRKSRGGQNAAKQPFCFHDSPCWFGPGFGADSLPPGSSLALQRTGKNSGLNAQTFLHGSAQGPFPKVT